MILTLKSIWVHQNISTDTGTRISINCHAKALQCQGHRHY